MAAIVLERDAGGSGATEAFILDVRNGDAKSVWPAHRSRDAYFVPDMATMRSTSLAGQNEAGDFEVYMREPGGRSFALLRTTPG